MWGPCSYWEHCSPGWRCRWARESRQLLRPGRLNSRDDDLEQDDSVTIVLDTLHDRRTGRSFATSPLGTKFAGRIRDDGRVSDSTWDAAWTSAAQRTGDGWSAEFAIPFRVLTFKTGEDVTWGFNIGRTRRGNLERPSGTARSRARHGSPSMVR